ncbi:capsid protein [Crucivirus-411]|nr:capsid protein [Crucivirus-411]
MPKYNFNKAFHGKTNRSYAKQISQGLASKAIMRRQIGRGLKYVKQQFGGMQPMNAGMISGMGDYKVHSRKPYVTGRGFKRHGSGTRRTPHISLEKGQMTLTHTEYIGDLIAGTGASPAGPSAFQSQSYACQAANAGSYPFLSSTAQNFQEYKFHKLVYEYRPLVSESSSTTNGSLLSMGSVIVATQYNSSVGPYLNKATMAESDYAVTTKPSEHLLHAVECDVKYNPMGILYTSAQTSLTQGSNGTDIRMQNLGLVQFASVGIPLTMNTPISLGEIWVHYTVSLYKPVLNAGLSALESAHYFGNASVGNPTASNAFGPNVNITTGVQPSTVTNNLLTLTFPTSNRFAFPLQVTTGSYLVNYYCKGASTTTAAASPTIVAPPSGQATGAILVVFNNGTTYGSTTIANSPQSGATTTLNLACSFVVQVDAPGSSLCIVDMGTIGPPSAGLWDLIVTPYNSIMR